MSNTAQRIVSAMVLLGILLFSAFLGPNGVLAFIFLAGVLLVDEIIFSMLKVKRSHLSYYLSISTFIGGYLFFNFFDRSPDYNQLISNAGISLSLFLILYLFMEKMESRVVVRALKKNTYVVGLYVLIPFLSLTQLIHKSDWVHYLVLLLLLNSAVDIGAWFFGKNFGKRKLWTKISPNKTLFGLFGGVASSVILSSIYLYVVFGRLDIPLILSLIGLGLLAQVGDLIESKMKRQLEVKDSSNLIPGHGGIYDRVDSLVFIAPFYALVIRTFL